MGINQQKSLFFFFFFTLDLDVFFFVIVNTFFWLIWLPFDWAVLFPIQLTSLSYLMLKYDFLTNVLRKCWSNSSLNLKAKTDPLYQSLQASAWLVAICQAVLPICRGFNRSILDPADSYFADINVYFPVENAIKETMYSQTFAHWNAHKTCPVKSLQRHHSLPHLILLPNSVNHYIN